MQVNKAMLFNILYAVLTLAVAVASVFGYGDFHPDPQLVGIVTLLAALLPALINLVLHQAAQTENAALRRELTSRGIAPPPEH